MLASTAANYQGAVGTGSTVGREVLDCAVFCGFWKEDGALGDGDVCVLVYDSIPIFVNVKRYGTIMV